MPHAKAALFKGPQQPFEIREYPLLPPEKGTVRLDLIACGICGTDVHIHDGGCPAHFRPSSATNSWAGYGISIAKTAKAAVSVPKMRSLSISLVPAAPVPSAEAETTRTASTWG